MSDQKKSSISRRTFVRQTGLLAGGMLAAGGLASLPAAELSDKPAPDAGQLPKRVLGRTKVPLTTLTLGTAPCGLCPEIPPPEIAKIVNAALDLGINSVDTAPAYKQAEEGVGLALGSRRKEIFLSTKVPADTVTDAEQSLANSLRLLKTDYLDLLYYHSIGNREVARAMDADGTFTWLLKQKQAGKCRFVGISGHNLPARFPVFLETGEVDVLLTVINFVDRHTYNFETDVLPIARKHNVGIVAMKVFGGARRKAGSYQNPKAPPELDLKHLQLAVRYSLGISGVASLNIGVHNIKQLRNNVELAKSFQPLSAEEVQMVDKIGRQLAQEWGPHFGPVA